MNIKKMPIYICSPNIGNTINISHKRTIVDHKTGELNDRLIIYPIKINTETINPKNFVTLSEELNIDEILLIDRIKEKEGVVAISDHVNVSGQNFLRANTPYKDLPQFPDMSKIFNSVEGYDKTVVHTVGPQRFENKQASNSLIYSELVGLIAPVAHYVGIKVFALGLSKTEEIFDII